LLRYKLENFLPLNRRQLLDFGDYLERAHNSNLRASELLIDVREFALHLRVSSHSGEFSFPIIIVGRHGEASAVNQTFEQGKLGFCNKWANSFSISLRN
jgi:hypothetical protein